MVRMHILNNECFQCGKTGHKSQKCPNRKVTQVSYKAQRLSLSDDDLETDIKTSKLFKPFPSAIRSSDIMFY